MIVINEQTLKFLGLSDKEISDLRALPASTLVVATCFSFDAGGESGQANRLLDAYGLTKDTVPPVADRRDLLLVGVGDRYGAGQSIARAVTEIGIADNGISPRPLTAAECDVLGRELWGTERTARLRDAIDDASRPGATPAAQPQRSYLVITRHKGLVQYLREQGHIGELTRVIDQATEADVTGQHVIGILPIRLAALCASYSECSLVLETQDRGISDLPIERIRQIAQPLTTYRVSVVG